MKTILCLLLFCVSCFSQEITITQPTKVATVDVAFHFTMPESDEYVKTSKLVESMAPATILWMWGDDSRKFDYFPFAKGRDVRHTYKPGRYTALVSVIDSRNRLIRQSAITFNVTNSLAVPVE